MSVARNILDLLYVVFVWNKFSTRNPSPILEGSTFSNRILDLIDALSGNFLIPSVVF